MSLLFDMKTIFPYSILIFTLILSTSSKSPKTRYWINEKDIPGIQFIDAEFGIDRTEVTNFHWCEFLYWTGRMYGCDSKEYQSILPDTTVWEQLDTSYLELKELYLRHPSFRNNPVVGISYEQAEKYCKWRSDRVFEYLLIKAKYWSFNQSVYCDSTDFVSIERYENCELKDIPPNAKVNRFPHYHLPSEKEWYKAMKYNEQRMIQLSKMQLKKLKDAKGIDKYKDKPISAEVYTGRGRFSNRWIFYLDRNVSELLSDGKSAVGSNWGSITNTEVFPVTNISNVFIGFRCAFEWKEPKKKD